ncbi:ABC transporter permease [Acidisphaera sp. S103]|uniref:ABC transporter permease n=1 Tax=Acidisphaera sp. S103 TaxID=1747223 RepID=UPI00131ADA90|nr:ABC transporter permease [Acidisphaera sp. S103]
MKPSPQAEPPPTWQLRQANGRDVLTLTGDWIAQSGRIPEFTPDTIAAAHTLTLDVAGVTRWDSGLIEFLWDAKRAAASAGIPIDTSPLPASAQKLLGLLPDSATGRVAPPRRRFRPLTWLGGETIGLLTELGILTTLLGAAATGGTRALAGRARMRGVDLLANIGDAGPSALVIVSTVNFLVGAILAFVGAVQLRKFAADIYVADLVGLALVREMAAVMTAIIMAGRTGGAYAARIATMQGNEEIDALQVIGIPVADYIVLPSILALVFTMPFLYLYGCLVGMFGGFVVALAMLSVTGPGYLNETLNAVAFSQFIFGFVKSIAFAILIGVTSCRIGLKAGRSAADVGTAATNAVVTGIVGVIALDAIFAVLANVVGL